MIRSETITKLSAALLKAQMAISSAKKGGINPHYKSRYADLGEVIESVKPALNKNGLSFLQIVTLEGVETIILHESGEYIGGTTPIRTAKENDPQAMGSAITYAKRYGLQAILGVPTEDDDGEKAMGRAGKIAVAKGSAAESMNINDLF